MFEYNVHDTSQEPNLTEDIQSVDRVLHPRQYLL